MAAACCSWRTKITEELLVRSRKIKSAHHGIGHDPFSRCGLDTSNPSSRRAEHGFYRVAVAERHASLLRYLRHDRRDCVHATSGNHTPSMLSM